MENPNLLNFYNKSLQLITPNVTQSISIEQIPLIDATRIQSSDIVDSVSLSNGFLKSGSYVSGSAGWKIDANGDVEFNNGYFRGDITGATGTFSGTITGGSLNIPDTTTANSFHVDSDGNAWWGAVAIGDSTASILNTGEAEFTDIIIKGGATGYKTGNGTFLGYDESEELEQWYTPTSNLGDYLWGDNTTNKVGQGFSITDGQTNISSIHVWLKMKTAAQTSNTITCDLYLLDTATLLPTGASLGQASIDGIDNTDYEEKTFTFSSPITINSSNLYVFVLDTSYTSGDGIYLKHTSSLSAYQSGELVRYTSSWATVVNQDASFEIYSKYSAHKLYVGNSDYSLTFNSAFIDATEQFIVRDGDTSDTFAKYEDDGISFISSGQTIFSINSNGTIVSRLAKGLSAGFLNVYTISSTGSSSSDVLNDGSGFRVTENKGGATMTFSNQGLIVSNGIGNAGNKQTVYCSALSACPLPSTDNALDKFKNLPEPKTKDKLHKPEKAHFEFKEPGKKRKYFDIDDVPDEVTFINNEGEKDIELIRVIGFCFQALKELNEEVEILKKRLNIKNGKS